MLSAFTALVGSAAVLALLFTTETGAGIAEIWIGLVLLLTAIMIVHRVLSLATVTLQSIYGALSAYRAPGERQHGERHYGERQN